MGRRSKIAAALLLVSVLVTITTAGRAFAAPRWTNAPSIAVVATPDDPRVPIAREAIAHWEATLEGIPTALRLGPVHLVDGTVPAADLHDLSERVAQRRWPTTTLPDSALRFPGAIVLVLSDTDMVSLTARDGQRAVIGIKGDPRLTARPAILRNVIAHELGHALGLQHNQDATTLMCGRPAACGPGRFEVDPPRIFPLTTTDERALAAGYPSDVPRRD